MAIESFNPVTSFFFLSLTIKTSTNALLKCRNSISTILGWLVGLLDIRTTQTLALSPYRGSLFESLIISDFHKQFYNNGISSPSLYYWRDQNGRIEVDCIIDRGDMLFPVEIKSGETISSSFFTSLADWNRISRKRSKPLHDHLCGG